MEFLFDMREDTWERTNLARPSAADASAGVRERLRGELEAWWEWQLELEPPAVAVSMRAAYTTPPNKAGNER